MRSGFVDRLSRYSYARFLQRQRGAGNQVTEYFSFWKVVKENNKVLKCAHAGPKHGEWSPGIIIKE